MEKKIERVPYISKWYKEEQKDELLNFAFYEQNAGSDLDVDKFSLYDKNLYTYSTNTTNGLWTTGYSKPTVQLKYVCNLTQEDVDNIDNYIKDIYHKIGDCQRTKTLYRINEICVLTYAIQKYIENIDGIRDKKQRQQLERLEKQSEHKKTYEGTLGEHWKELMELFRIKTCLLGEWKNQFKIAINNLKEGRQAVDRLPSKLDDIAKNLGIEFIEDFVKACEKCEE